ncbi:phosphate uptake regulator PhoU [Candidatus Woesearchaeota archaeon]|nr:phosphate uptake regulator PhoU [Candidatus Woesearchaeota archaeon]
MKRKVIKQGNGTLTVTLPKYWTQEIGLKGGDEIDILAVEDGLLLSTSYHTKEKTMSLNIDNMERLPLTKLLIACFEQGYDSITLTFSKSKIKSWSHGEEGVTDLIRSFISVLIGFEVLSETKTSIKIGNLSEKHTNFENILSRAFFLLEEYIDHLISAMKSNDLADLKNRENRHDNITKLLVLGRRMIYEDTMQSKAQAINYFTIMHSLDKVTDFIRWAYKNTFDSNKKVSKEIIQLAEKAKEYLELYRHFFYKFDYKLINSLDSLRGEVKKLYIKSSKTDQAGISGQLEAFVETLHGIVEPRVALELAKGIS